MAKKYLRPLNDILDEVVSGMEFPVSIKEVVLNDDGSQTLMCCDIYHAQTKFKVTINDLEYEITAISQAGESITVVPTFEGVATILPGVTFFLYKVFFFHGTPVTTQQDLQSENNADNKTPMIWRWEHDKEKFHRDEIVERTSPEELYCLSQFPVTRETMKNDDIVTECVEPMRRLAENFMNELFKRSDLFSTDEQEYEIEAFPKFAIMAKNKGAGNAVLMDNLSGVGLFTTLELWYQSTCDECEEPEYGIGSMIVSQNFIVT